MRRNPKLAILNFILKMIVEELIKPSNLFNITESCVCENCGNLCNANV